MEFSTVSGVLLPDGSINQINIPGIEVPAWEKNVFDYGDGHLNTVKSGYDNILYTYSSVEKEFQKIEVTSSLYGFGGNFRCQTYKSVPYFTGTTSFGRQDGEAGTNYYSCNIDGTKTEYTVCIMITYGSWTTGIAIGQLFIRVNGTEYSLKQCVDLGIIKPLVPIFSGDTSGPYFFDQILNIYDNSKATDTRNYPGTYIYFMLNKGNKIDQIRYFASVAHGAGYHDGINVAIKETDLCRFCLKQN